MGYTSDNRYIEYSGSLSVASMVRVLQTCSFRSQV
jgi:hypothetical protein